MGIQVWDILNRKVREHEAKLDEAGDLQRFLRDLDHFQAWLTATQRQVNMIFVFLYYKALDVGGI